MELFNLQNDIPVMGVHVKTFPAGIKEAFDSLVEKFGFERHFYGISWMDDANNVVYYAMTGETSAQDAEKNNYERMTIGKGDYNTETIVNWMSKTDSIKDVFHNLTKAHTPDRQHPCVEWYKSDDEMLCMVKA